MNVQRFAEANDTQPDRTQDISSRSAGPDRTGHFRQICRASEGGKSCKFHTLFLANRQEEERTAERELRAFESQAKIVPDERQAGRLGISPRGPGTLSSLVFNFPDLPSYDN